MRRIFMTLCCLVYGVAFSQPVISSFSPASGPVGTSTTITGTGFSATPANNIVYFGAVRATVSLATATSLEVIVPVSASFRPITVTAGGRTGYSKKPFTVTFPGGGLITVNSFAQSAEFTTDRHYTIQTAAMDLDFDGKPELITNSLLAGVGPQSLGFISVAKNNCTPGNLSFGSIVHFPNTGLAYYFDFGDMDGDGRPDIVASHTEPSSDIGKLVVFQNSGANGVVSFAPALTCPTSGGWGVAVADFDGDGFPDAATSNNSINGIVSVHRNTSFGGLISFAAVQNFATTSYPRAVTTGFINNDDKPDMIVAIESGKFSIFINNSTPGNISFLPKQDIVTPGTSCNHVAIGDLDGDDKADLAVTTFINSVGTVSVYRNTGTSGVAFAPPINLITSLNWGSFHINLADIDGDGKADISVSSAQAVPTVRLFRNTSVMGVISFASVVDYNSISASRTVLGSDLDGDSRPELIAGVNISSSNYTHAFAVFRNTVDKPNIASFAPLDGCSGTSITISGTNFTGATAVSFGALAASSFSVVSSTLITAVVGNGATGAVSVTTPAGTSLIGGFTHTGVCVLPPVIHSFVPSAAAAGNTLMVSGQNFSSTPTNNIVYFGPVRASVISASETTLEVVVPAGANNAPITVTTNNLTAYSPKPFASIFVEGENCDPFSANSFAPKKDLATGTSPYFVILADLDNNNKPDIQTANFASNNISILKNRGEINTNVFDPKADLACGTQPIGTSFGDIDGDGKPDLAVANYASNTVSVFRNTTTGSSVTYAPKVDFPTNANPRNLVVRDINFDGKPDILVTCYGANSFSVLRNTGSGVGVIAMAGHVPFAAGNSPVGIYVQDMDGDNKPDVAVANLQSNSISVLKNTSTSGTGVSFDAKIDFQTGSQPISVFVNDLDGDEKPDLVAANYGSASVSVLKNSSTGGNLSFAAKIDYNTGNGPFSVTVADLNADSKPEIATANAFEANLSVLRNSSTAGIIYFSAKTDYPTGINPRNITAGDIDGDGKTDLVTANSGDNSVSILKNTFASIPGQVCPGGSTSFTSNINGSLYQWEVNTGSGFINIADNTAYTGTTTASLIISNITSDLNRYAFRCVADGIPGATSTLNVISKWTGVVDMNWGNPGNWSCNLLPDANTDVIISCGRTVTINENASCRSLSLKQGSNLLIQPGVELYLSH